MVLKSYRYIFLCSILIGIQPLCFGKSQQHTLQEQVGQALSDLENVNNQTQFCAVGFRQTAYVSYELRENRRVTRESLQNYLADACGEEHPQNAEKNVLAQNSEFHRTFSDIYNVADCLKIPMEALYAIWIRETGCGLRSSSANGVGPLQFTSAGVQEVNDQLGLRGVAQARASATKYFNETLECVSERTGKSRLIFKSRNDFNNKLIESAVYAGILLKVSYSVEASRDDGACKNIFNETSRINVGNQNEERVNQCWARVFWRYNGNEHHQDEYSRVVTRYMRDMAQQEEFVP